MKRMKKWQALFTFMLVFTFLFLSTTLMVHATDLDTLNGSDSSGVTQQAGSSTEGDSVKDTEMDEGATAIADAIRGQSAVTSEDMEKASKLTSPITKIIGNVIGIIMVLVSSLIFLVTALDLAYIALPFTRGFLNPQNQTAGGSGGFMGGFGSRGGYGGMGGMGMGGMGMGMGGGAPQGDPNARKWVSDEAVAALMATQQPPQQQGGMGMGMGGFGMGGMGMPQPNQAPSGGKTAIVAYLKKRIFFLILFAVASVLLMSSIFTDCGLNLAQLGYKIMNMFNSGIENVNIG